ncbi:MAG: LOG family protein [Deltaproteobacteria bacterium]|nr:LOG family protein [Deltaproteobacteria bacterium]
MTRVQRPASRRPGIHQTTGSPPAAKPGVAAGADGRPIGGPGDQDLLDHHTKLTGSDLRAPSSTRRVDQPGARARIDLRHWQPEQLKRVFLEDIRRSFDLLKRLPPAVTFFGGARIKPDDPYYALARELGRLLATASIPPRTGGGPGIMTAVPEGYKTANPTPVPDAIAFHPLVSGFSEQAAVDDTRTQAFSIILPYEQKIADAIDVAEEIAQFPYRKAALYENARGLVTFPGGYGTLDELFEVWTRGVRGRHHDPMVVVGSEFWGPVLGAVEEVAVRQRGLIKASEWSQMKMADQPAAILGHLASADNVRGFETDPEAEAAAMGREIASAVETLARLPTAVTFIGGHLLPATASECGVAREAARLLTRAGVPTRVGGNAAVAEAVAVGTRAARPSAEVQGFIIKSDDTGRQIDGLKIHMAVDESITHKELIGRRCRAFVALPGGLCTLAELFSVLTQIQCGMIEKVPILLVGSSYWRPIFDAIKAQMLDGPRQTIAPEDLDMVTITDDPAVIARAVADAGGRAT